MDETKFLENATKLASLLNNKSDNGNDMEKMLKIAKSLKSLKENTKNDIPKETSNLSKISLENQNIKTMKSVLPLLDLEHKTNIGVFIEIMEVNHILNEYKILKNKNDMEKNSLKKDAIVAIKSKLKEHNQDFIDLILKFLEITEIKNKINSRKE